MAIAAEPKKVTYDEYSRLPEEPPVELIHGDLFVIPLPDFVHQRVSWQISSELKQWLSAHPVGIGMTAPVLLSKYDCLQPDIVFVSNKRLKMIVNEHVEGVPDFIVEVVSSSSASRDMRLKKALYEEHGVQEYWIVDPASKKTTQLVLEAGKFRTAGTYSESADLESTVIPGFKVSLSKLFSS